MTIVRANYFGYFLKMAILTRPRAPRMLSFKCSETTTTTTTRGATMATIKVKNPVRNAFSDCSTGNDNGRYYETKGAAVHAFYEVLDHHGYHFDPDHLIDFPNDAGRRTIDIFDESDECVGRALLTWYRMEMSGRYEFVGYIC